MSLSRRSILQNLRTYSRSQLDHISDCICANIITEKISTAWQDIIHAIDANIDRRLGYPALFIA